MGHPRLILALVNNKDGGRENDNERKDKPMKFYIQFYDTSCSWA